jgi:hypothetical protein
MKNTAICFLTVSPSRLFFDFCKQLAAANPKYSIYICIDNNSHKITEADANNESYQIIKLNKRVCEAAGFKGTVTYFSDNVACSRDKALFYFCRVKRNQHARVWFIEEDVLIPSMQTIQNIDNKYPLADLLSSNHNIKNDKKIKWNNPWHWKRIFRQTPLPPPYATSMICAIRVSNALLNHINRYAALYKKLFVDEAFFNTIALKANMLVKTPLELNTIVFRKDWNPHEIFTSNLYHPIKSIEMQHAIRAQIKK